MAWYARMRGGIWEAVTHAQCNLHDIGTKCLHCVRAELAGIWVDLLAHPALSQSQHTRQPQKQKGKTAASNTPVLKRIHDTLHTVPDQH